MESGFVDEQMMSQNIIDWIVTYAIWAGTSLVGSEHNFAQGPNVVLAALGFENRRLELVVVDIDADMRR